MLDIVVYHGRGDYVFFRFAENIEIFVDVTDDLVHIQVDIRQFAVPRHMKGLQFFFKLREFFVENIFFHAKTIPRIGKYINFLIKNT